MSVPAHSDSEVILHAIYGLGRRLDETNQRLDETNQRLDETNQRLEHIEQRLEHIKREVKETRVEVMRQGKRLDAVSVVVQPLAERMLNEE